MSNQESGSYSLWDQLGPVEQAKEWEAFQSGTLERVIAAARDEVENRRKAAENRRKAAEKDAAHRRHLDYLVISVQVLAILCGFGAVVILALTAKYYIDHGAPSDGSKIFGIGAGSIVAAFLGINATSIFKRVNKRFGTGKSSDE